ncbi:MAG TPA: hypothetical protein DEB30_02020 [Candidatus Peribacter riflensis]|uniref:Uncharacterized protein n=1 Tax=Candidatus Peribacter riflensis TaxID=1735162 RepID=A0A0S1SIZ1_9BACT|nr:MAG: hypothetical protein PeribacterA2_0177 [Candidatus Peribacter riflensis]OGJ78110.1 MAG: hypothetical protein A2412_03385 [Candidatus Peribacteria bacterium RIFOXYC1_FULL_58_8]OGJ79354.1 MAG: hypothetical protein A2398_04245 [Candidatus Peribacteria bacterium RIFOXYB1_FULL_57_12]ALM10673.1 MAG: hypothetical protein PeribacterB2_0177 [Candidatus Peribacter riflensis]ALM11775.1 MAG: hypothetical protein PeribacterC2_0176 [Candidatus Peribacter riflensis]
MNSAIKILSSAVGLSLLWLVMGIVFVPLDAVDQFSNYFVFALLHALLFFLPLSIALFSTRMRWRIFSAAILVLYFMIVAFSLQFLFSSSLHKPVVSDLFTLLYMAPGMFPFALLTALGGSM